MSAIERQWLLDAKGGSVQDFYTEINIPLPNPAGEEATIRCFANPIAHRRDDRDPSCSVNLLTGLWKCHGCGMSGNPYAAAVAVGYSETRARELARYYGVYLEQEPQRDKPKLPGERQLKKWRVALRESPRILARLAELKGWTLNGIVRCSLGWDGERIVFPVRNSKLKIVGVARYKPGADRKMVALPGSKRELFPAPEVTSRKRPLFVVEGEPDAVSVWSCGHQAVGVPGALSWRREWASRLAGRTVIVLVDCDAQGRDLARRIVESGVSCRVVDLDPGRTDGHDIGEWVAECSREGGLWQLHRVLGRLAA